MRQLATGAILAGMATAPTTHRRRRVLVGTLLALAVVTGLFAMFAVWTNRQALNTDNWTKTSGDLLANKHVQNAVGAYLVSELFRSTDIQAEIQNVLPPQLAALAGPASAGLHQLADRAAPRLLASPAVQDAWRRANRGAHEQLLQIINGGGSVASTKNGEVVLNVHSLVDQLAANLGVEDQVAAARSKVQGDTGAKARGVAQQKFGVTLPPSTGRLVIMRSDQLATAQDVGSGIRNLAIVLTGLSLGLFALAVWLAVGWRRVALIRTGWCFIGLGVAVLLARRVVGDQVVDGLVSNPSAKPAAHATWAIGTSLLYDIAIAMFAYGVILAVAAWLAGPSRAATAVRHALAPSLRHRLVAVYGVLAVVFLLILLWGPTAATRKPLGIALFAVLLVLGVEVLRRRVAREFPDARKGESSERLRTWATGRFSRKEAPAPGPSSTPATAHMADLERLGDLRDRGLISSKEYDAEKVLVLNGS